MVVVLARELGELGVPEVKAEVQIRGGHLCSLDPNSFLMTRKRRLEEERWHLSSRKRWLRTWEMW